MKKVLYILIGVLLIGGLSGSLQSMANEEDLDETIVTQRGILTRVKETTGNTINGFGNINIWNLVKVKDLLPFSIVAYCSNKHPKQTLVVLGLLLVWCLFKTEKGNKLLQKFKGIAEKAIGVSDELPTARNEECVIDSPVNNKQQSDKQDQSIINDTSVAAA